jgi:hypothetical protein
MCIHIAVYAVRFQQKFRPPPGADPTPPPRNGTPPTKKTGRCTLAQPVSTLPRELRDGLTSNDAAAGPLSSPFRGGDK